MNRGRRALAIVLWVAMADFAAPAEEIDCYTQVPPAYRETDVRSLIRAVTPADVERIRRELMDYIWKTPALPAHLPEVEQNADNPFPDLPDPPNVIRIDQLTVSIDGFVSRMYLFLPQRRKRQLVIYHHGHSIELRHASGVDTVRFFLERRYPVLVVHPPLFGPNSGPIADPPVIGPVPPGWKYHDLMFELETPTRSPVRYFLEPIVLALNYAERVLRPRSVTMIGISGGGWATTLVAALDPRVRISFPVAGSLPLYLQPRGGACSRWPRDREQYHPPLYAIASYPDLYVLGAYGRGRGQLQVLNQFDRCCFYGVGFLTYKDIVKNVVGTLGKGRYDVFLDSSHRSHVISRHALEEAVLPFLKRRRL
jgi:hypothetical protein